MKTKAKKKIEDKEPTPTYKRLRGAQIKKPQDCIKLMNRLINICLNGCTDEELVRLKAIAYTVSTLIRVFESGEIEDRLENLEERLIDNEHKA